MAVENATGVSGSCYCRGIKFLISPSAEPYWSGYCHCDDCRRSHSAPMYQAAYFLKENFQIIEGAELLKWYTHTESSRDTFQRYFCERCGTRVYNALRGPVNGIEADAIGIFPSLFDDQKVAISEPWLPRHHVFVGEAIMDLPKMHDDLPRFPENVPDEQEKHWGHP